MTKEKVKHYVIDNPSLMAEWDWINNEKLGYSPYMLTCGSNIKVYWICSNNHSYLASISHKSHGRGCPYCSNHKVLAGFNDLQTKFPEIAKEWNYEKNYPLRPTDVLGGNKKKVYWTCPKGHVYDMPILDRTQGNGCPICSGKRVIKGINDLATTHPYLLEEWDYSKNNLIGKYPDSITYGHTKSAYWKCKICGYEWKASPNNRTNGKTGCPCCTGRVVVAGVNDLETKFPDIAKKWHPTKNKKKPCEFTAFSNSDAWWVCDKEPRHVFPARINHVTKGEIVCPICSNQKIIVGVNDFQTTNPELMDEWNWEKNNALGILPTETTRGYGGKVEWKCKVCGHTWSTTIASRTSQRTGCPKCKKDLSSSFPEKAIAYYLSKWFNVEENKKFAWLGQSEIDIYVKELNFGVEYDGKVWHQDIKRDIKKDKLCQDNNIVLIRVREKECPLYESSSRKIIRSDKRSIGLTQSIQKIKDLIEEIYNLNLNGEIDVDKDYTEILSKISTLKKENSVASTDLIKSWNFRRNGTLSPETISTGSHKKVWWICEVCGHEWPAVVSSRAGKQKCGCPVCAGQKVVPGQNDFETLYPNLAKEWDSTKNTKKPSEVRPMDNRKYWWVCSKCGKSYLSPLSARVGRNRSCPDCARLKTISSHYKKVINITTNEIFESIREASERTGVNPNSISNCCRGKSKSAGGYVWEFKKEDNGNNENS